jgi:hypothetical protein
MKPTLRTILDESHIAIIAITILLGQGIMWLFQLVWFPASEALKIMTDAIKYPYAHYSFSLIFGLQSVYLFLGEAIPCFAVAWILSVWVFGAGPFEVLIGYHARLEGRHG